MFNMDTCRGGLMSIGLLAFLAFIPILTALILMAGMRWPSTRAMPIAWLAGVVLAFAFWFLVTNVFRVAVRRVFLEGMIYENVTSQRFTFLLRIKEGDTQVRSLQESSEECSPPLAPLLS